MNSNRRTPCGDNKKRPARIHRGRPHAVAAAVAQICAVLTLASAPVWAGPQGGVVRQGQASIGSSILETTVVQKSDRAVIDWRSFDLKSYESVRFLQPSASAAVLNRVLGDRRSEIAGRIVANGQVFLVNPYGIVFTKEAQVDVGALVASTADIADAAFMRGGPVLRFDKPGRTDAGIDNQGVIQLAEGGVLALVARSVTEQGTVRARLGKVSLAGSDAFTLDFAGDRLVSLILDPSAMETLTDATGNKLAAMVDAKGNIRVEGGTLDLTAGTVSRALDSVIKISGDVRATRVEARGDGKIRLLGGDSTDVTIGGTFEVQGAAAVLQARGRKITVASGALVGFTQAGSDGAQGAGIDLAASQDLQISASLNGYGSDSRAQGGPLQLKAGGELIVDANVTLATRDAPITLDAGGRLEVRTGTTIESLTRIDSRAADTRLSGAKGVKLEGSLVSHGTVTIDSSNGTVSAATALAGAKVGEKTQLPTDVTVKARDGIKLAGVNATGSVNLTSTAGVFAGAVHSPGAITLDGGAGGVRVTQAIHGGALAVGGKLEDAASAGDLSVAGKGNIQPVRRRAHGRRSIDCRRRRWCRRRLHLGPQRAKFRASGSRQGRWQGHDLYDWQSGSAWRYRRR
jgi:filamentous hemagglutinin family protein